MNINLNRADILVVDDSPANLKLLEGMLKQSGYKARMLPNGRLALQAVADNPPDLILLDINMPDMDGYEVCRRLKEDERLQEIPVIFLSSLTDTNDKIKAFAIGGVDYITKPFQFEEVEARVETHLQIQRHKKEIERLHREQEAFLRHELNNYLTPVLGFTVLLEKRLKDLGDKEKQWLGNIKRGAQQMTALVEEIKKLHGFETGHFELEQESVDVARLIKEILIDLRMIFSEAIIDVNGFDTSTQVTADASLLKGVYQNLIKNALEHVAGLEDPKQRPVRIDLLNENGCVVVKINNRGPTIPSERIRSFFDKFNSSKHKSGGTGLGTTYAHLVTKAHGGDIEVTSNDEEGTTLTVSLPSAM